MPPPALTLQLFSATRTQYLVSVLNSPFDVRERTESCLPSAKHAIRQCTEDDDNDVIGNLNANAEALSGASPPVDYMFMMAFAGDTTFAAILVDNVAIDSANKLTSTVTTTDAWQPPVAPYQSDLQSKDQHDG